METDIKIDYDKLWKSVLSEIEVNTSKITFSMWFKDTNISNCADGVAYINVPNNFVKDWLSNKYHKFIIGALRNNIPSIRSVDYLIVSNAGSSSPQSQKNNTTPSVIYTQNTEEQLGFSEFNIDKIANLNPKYTFESFVVAPFNEIAHAAAMSVAKSPGSLYNPLFIYGGVGLGKTHLLQSIGNEMRKNNQKAKVYYLTSEKFANEYVSSIQNKTTNTFKDKYRKYNLLIVDDIQFFSDKLKIQEEFFHVFNSLYESGNQIVFSSDKSPQNIVGLEDRLRSRFEGGMMIDISHPEYEERLAILKVKTNQKNFDLSDEILAFIAELIKENIRELEGALNSIIGQSKIRGRELTKEEVADILKKKIKPVKIVNIEQVIKTILGYYNLNERHLTEKTRRKEIVKPRQVAMYILRNDLNTSYPHIGRRFGHIDHTTVMHACKKIADEIKIDKKLEQEIINIKNIMYKISA